MNVGVELQLEEEVHDVKFLHNESMFAVAQREYTYIYDSHGTEIHCVRNLSKPYRLDFLPYHYLLVSIGQHGWIRWHDISTGLQVGGYATGLGSCNVMKHNRQNSITHLGHRNGIVTLWSPAAGKALVSLFCHKTPIADLAIDRDGRYLASAGYDGRLKIWDLRTYRNLHTYHLDAPATSLDISDSGLLGLSMGRNIQILRDPYRKPTDLTYLKHEIRTPNMALSSGGGVTAATKALKSSVSIQRVRFRPLEDILCAGHSHGISTIIVPGAGEANYDAYEANPFRTLKQRREEEIQTLLHKLSPDMIVLDSKLIGSVDKDLKTLQEEHKELFQTANAKAGEHKKERNKMRGKNKISSKLRRKQKNVIDEQVIKLKSMLEEERKKETDESQQGDATKSKGKKRDADALVAVSSKTAAEYDPLNRFERKNK
jgi:U3 small nucleolar RNA-associated protein 7